MVPYSSFIYCIDSMSIIWDKKWICASWNCCGQVSGHRCNLLHGQMSNFRPEAIFTPTENQHIAYSPVRVTMLMETIHIHICFVHIGFPMPQFMFTPHPWHRSPWGDMWAVLMWHRMSLWNDVCEEELAKSPQLLCGLPLRTRLVGHGVKLLLHMWWDN